MDVRNCRSCGRMFNFIGNPICPECAKAVEEKFDDVKQYIYEHPRCSIHEVAEEMDISVTQIRKWLKEERLTFSEDSDIALNCEKCGRRILTGRFCKNCKDSMTSELSSIYKKNEPQASFERKKVENKMRYLDN